MRTSRLSGFGPLWNQLNQFQSEMNQLFDRWGGGHPAGPATFPAFNVWEEADHVWVEAEVPGLALEDLEILVTGGNELTVKGVRKPVVPEGGVWHRRERSFGAFERSLTLPFVVDADRVEARLENGVLRIELARHESARPRKIQVKGE